MGDPVGRSGTHGGLRVAVTMLLATALGWGALALAAHRTNVVVSDSDDLAALRTTVVVVVLVAGCIATALAWRRPERVPPFVVVATAVGVSGLATAALQGTRYAFSALHSDSAFRTQAVTRFADSAALADYAYQELPAYYPPAWPWTLGRVADLFDLPAWTVVKPATLLVAALLPIVAYLLWRRVLPAAEAAAVVLLTTLAVGNLQKPDEWLVLALLIPWWLEVVRGIRAEGVHPRRAWVDGVVVGALLVTHSVYFLPLGVATVLGWCVDLARRRPAPLPVTRMFLIGAVGLVVATPYWLPLLIGRLTSESSDNLQMRWSPAGQEVPPLPVEPEWWLPLAAVGVVWILLRSLREPLAMGVVLVLGAGYLVTVGGQWLQQYGVAVLAHKAEPVVLSALVVAGVLVAGAVVRGALSRWSTRRSGSLRGALLPAVVVVTVLGLVLPGAVSFTDVWAVGKQAQVPQQMPYPDGSFPEGHDPARTEHTWGTSVGDPSTAEVLDAWRELSGAAPEDDSETVLLTTRVDLLATTPVHPFTAWKSIYSHPNGQFEERVALLLDLAGCGTSACAARLLRDNPYDRVDGVIASRVDGRLHLPVGVDNFPEGWVAVDVVLPLRLFSGPSFRRTDVGSVTVVAVD